MSDVDDGAPSSRGQPAAVLAPGYGGSAEQPILRALARQLDSLGIASLAIAFSTRGRRPSAQYAAEVIELRTAREQLRTQFKGPVALVGRSFGGRMCTFLAVLEPPAALVVLGHPISPPKRPRPDDEAALAALTCPTLIVQGDRDELGPLAVLQAAAKSNPLIEIAVIRGAHHSFGAHEPEAVRIAAQWLAAKIGNQTSESTRLKSLWRACG